MPKVDQEKCYSKADEPSQAHEARPTDVPLAEDPVEIEPSEDYVNQCFDDLCFILDSFDQANSAHLEIVTRYLYLLKPGSLALETSAFGKDVRPYYFETYISNGNPEAPHYKNVSFELIMEGDRWRIDYHILVDFGQALPQTLHVFEKKWDEAYARFGVMLTSTKVLIGFLDAIVDAPQSKLTKNPGASSGVLYHVVEFCRQWGLSLGAERFFLKNGVSFVNGMDGQKINETFTAYFKPAISGPAMLLGKPDDPRLEKFRAQQHGGNEAFPTVEVFLFAPISEQLKHVLLVNDGPPNLEEGYLSHASELPVLPQLDPKESVLLKNGALVVQSLVMETMQLLEQIKQLDADFLHHLWLRAKDSRITLVIGDIPEEVLNKEAVLHLKELLSTDNYIRMAVRSVILSAVSGNEKNEFLIQLEDPIFSGDTQTQHAAKPAFDGYDASTPIRTASVQMAQPDQQQKHQESQKHQTKLIESKQQIPPLKRKKQTMHEAVGLDDDTFVMSMDVLRQDEVPQTERIIDETKSAIEIEVERQTGLTLAEFVKVFEQEGGKITAHRLVSLFPGFHSECITTLPHYWRD